MIFPCIKITCVKILKKSYIFTNKKKEFLGYIVFECETFHEVHIFDVNNHIFE